MNHCLLSLSQEEGDLHRCLLRLPSKGQYKGATISNIIIAMMAGENVIISSFKDYSQHVAQHLSSVPHMLIIGMELRRDWFTQSLNGEMKWSRIHRHHSSFVGKQSTWLYISLSACPTRSSQEEMIAMHFRPHTIHHTGYCIHMANQNLTNLTMTTPASESIIRHCSIVYAISDATHLQTAPRKTENQPDIGSIVEGLQVNWLPAGLHNSIVMAVIIRFSPMAQDVSSAG